MKRSRPHSELQMRDVFHREENGGLRCLSLSWNYFFFFFHDPNAYDVIVRLMKSSCTLIERKQEVFPEQQITGAFRGTNEDDSKNLGVVTKCSWVTELAPFAVSCFSHLWNNLLTSAVEKLSSKSLTN